MTLAVTLGIALLLALTWVAAWPALGQLDNKLEETPVSLQARIRRYLGTDHPGMEHTMATVLEALRALATQQQAASAAQLTAFTNLQHAVQRLETAVRDGEVSADIQAAVADLTEGFRVMQEAADAADNGYEPTGPVDGEQPTGEVPPVTDQVPTDGDGASEQPGDTRTARTR